VGRTGTDTERPALQRLMHLVNEGAVDKVAVYRLDRLSRSLRDSLDILDVFREAGVELLIVTAPDLGSAATDRFLLNIMATFAEFEREMISSRLEDARERLKRRGRRIAGTVPYGYDADPETKQLVVNPREARRVEAIFQMAADGMPPSQIAEAVNENGWRTKLFVAKRSGKERGGNPWTPRQVLALLNNPVYIGLFRDGDSFRLGGHQPLASRELWDLAHQHIDDRRTSSNPKRREAPFWPLRGKVTCPQCGRTMSPHAAYNGNVIYRYYRCRSHAGGRPPCKGSGLPAYELGKMVADLISDPDLAEDTPDVSQEQTHALHRFQVGWEMMDSAAQMQVLPEIINEVTVNEDASVLLLQVDTDAITRIASTLNDPGKSARDGQFSGS